MSRKIRLGLLVTELGLGGSEKAVALLARGLPRDEFDVSVACLFGPEPVGTGLRSQGVSVDDFGMAGRLDFRAVWRCRSWMRERGLDVVHAFLFHASFIARLARPGSGAPEIIHAQRNVEVESPLQRVLLRSTHRRVSRYTAVSEAARDHLVGELGIAPEKVVVIPNGIDLEAFDREAGGEIALEEGAPRVGTIGHMRRDDSKGYPTLAAAARLLGRRSRARLYACGEVDETMREPVEAEGIRLLGVRRDIPAFLRALDVYVQASTREGMPNAILEAMAAGLPVVATAVGGVPEVVVDGVTGILVPPEDPATLAEAISSLLDSPDRARTLGKAGRARIEAHFTAHHMLTPHRDLYTATA